MLCQHKIYGKRIPIKLRRKINSDMCIILDQLVKDGFLLSDVPYEGLAQEYLYDLLKAVHKANT
jgi:hypothetical protein